MGPCDQHVTCYPHYSYQIQSLHIIGHHIDDVSVSDPRNGGLTQPQQLT